MGAKLELRQHGQDLDVLGLSSNYVVGSDLLTSDTDVNTALVPSHPLFLSNSLIIKAPSDRDAILKLDDLNESIRVYKAQADRISGTLGLQANAETSDQSKKVLESALRTIERCDEVRQIINDSDRRAGHVYAASGYRSVPDSEGRPWTLNWSLTKLPPTRTMQNMAADCHGIKASFSLCHKATAPPADRQVAKVSLSKLGCPTGWTAGTVNAAEAIFSSSVGGYKENVYAWPVVPVPGFPFAHPDDSGAVLFDTIDYWDGLLFAANTATGVGFFTPIELVLNDIASVTGCEIFEPVQCD